MADSRIYLFTGDITQMHVDAIVNAANSALRGGGGVDGAIHRVAGSALYAACEALHGCTTGDAKITPGFSLPAKFIIHAVGPVWHGGKSEEELKLASCYRNSLRLAVENKCKTIAFPNISTGIYGFPKQLAAKVAVEEVADFLKNETFIEKVFFVCFDRENYDIYSDILKIK
jgi:O-acetyl-ADP-ribose deacetylase